MACLEDCVVALIIICLGLGQAFFGGCLGALEAGSSLGCREKSCVAASLNLFQLCFYLGLSVEKSPLALLSTKAVDRMFMNKYSALSEIEGGE